MDLRRYILLGQLSTNSKRFYERMNLVCFGQYVHEPYFGVPYLTQGEGALLSSSVVKLALLTNIARSY